MQNIFNKNSLYKNYFFDDLNIFTKIDLINKLKISNIFIKRLNYNININKLKKYLNKSLILKNNLIEKIELKSYVHIYIYIYYFSLSSNFFLKKFKFNFFFLLNNNILLFNKKIININFFNNLIRKKK